MPTSKIVIGLILIDIALTAGLYFRLFCRNKTRRTQFISVRFSGEKNMADLNLQVGQSSVGTVVPTQSDGTATPGAVVSNVTWSFTDPGVSVTPQADGTATFAGVAATTGDIAGSVTATVTDADGTVQSFSASYTVSVGGTTPGGGRTSSIGVTFSTPA